MSVLLSVQHATLYAPLGNRMILDDITYDVMHGDMVIILGGNGSGKSSLLKLIDKRYIQGKGNIFYKGHNIKQMKMQQYYRSVKTLTQSTAESLFASLTVLENYQLFAGQKSEVPFPDHAALANYLAEFNSQLAMHLHQPVMHLSGGEKQALLLALTMLDPPELLLLDEHTSALDPKSADLIMRLTNDMIKKHGITCLLTTHDLEMASCYGNRLLVLKEGRIHYMADALEKAAFTMHDLRGLYS